LSRLLQIHLSVIVKFFLLVAAVMRLLIILVSTFLAGNAYAGLEYQSFDGVNCDDFGSIAKETMMVWQSGASFKEMMESGESHESSFSPLVDAGSYMYSLSTEAMSKPVRQFSHSKTYESEIFGIDAQAVCELKKFKSYSGEYILNKRKDCRESAEYASDIMTSRQEGLPIKSILDLNQEEYENRISAEGDRRSELEKTYIETSSLIVGAYSIPIASTEIEKEQEVINYSANRYFECMK